MASCITNVTRNDDGYKRLRELYKDRKILSIDAVWDNILALYWSKRGLPEGFYPSTDEEIADFTAFIDYHTSGKKNTITSLNMKYKAMAGLYSTPKQLEDRVNMVCWDFRTEVDNIAKEKGMTDKSRAEVIKSCAEGDKNGFDVIIDKVFNKYTESADFSFSGMMEEFKANNPDATEDELLDAEASFRYVEDEYKKVAESKDMIKQFAAVKLGATEGFVVKLNDKNIEFVEVQDEIDQANAEENSSSENERGTDVDESSKGERYADFRVLRLMESLSPRARRLISQIVKRDAKGNIIRDDLGVPSFLEGRQVAVVLNRILVNTDSYSMMDTLRSEVSVYPWLQSLVDAIENDIDAQALIYNSFKKAETRYAFFNIQNGQYNLRFGNTRSRGNALAREAASNMISGFVLDNDYSVYNSLGLLITDEKLSDIEAVYDEVLEALKPATEINMIPGVNEEEGVDPVAAVREILEANPDAVNKLVKLLRGVGVPVSEEDIMDAAVQTVSLKSCKILYGQDIKFGNKLEWIMSGLNGIYNQVKYSNKYGHSYGEYLYSVTSSEFKHINAALNLAKYDEVESRFVDESRSLSTYNNVNLLHQVFDQLANREMLSEEEYQIMLERDYLQYEGMALGKDNIAHGWLAIFQDKDGRRSSFQVIDLPTFNHVEYAKMSSQQKLTSSLLMYLMGGDTFVRSDGWAAYEYPIQSDYSTAYNFITAPRYSLDGVIDGLAFETEMEYERIVAIQERQKNDPQEGEDPIRAKAEVYEKRGQRFQILPGLNNTPFAKEYHEASSPTERHEIAKKYVRTELIKIIKDGIAKIDSLGILKNELLKNQGLYNEDGLVSKLDLKHQEVITLFLANSFYARQQASKIVTGDYSNFDGIIDYEKRNMMTHATRTSPYLPAGREYERALYITDDKAETKFKNEISELIDQLVSAKVITSDMAREMKASYKSITTTDGQAFRTMESYREVKKMLADWTEEDENAYQNIVNGKYSANDIRVMMQNIKPVYTGYETIREEKGEFQKPIRLAVLHKYSEAVLLPTFLAKHCLQADSVPMRAFSNLSDRLSGKIQSMVGDVKILRKVVEMKQKQLDAAIAQRAKADLASTTERRERYARKYDRNISIAKDELFKAKQKLAAAETPVTLKNPVDIFLFKSCVKVGSHSEVKPFARVVEKDASSQRRLTNASDMADYIISKINSGDFYIHTLPMKYYGISASTPPHTADDKIAPASQAEKMIFANIGDKDYVIRDGKQVKATDNRRQFYDVKTAKIVAQFEAVRDIIKDKKALAELFQAEIADKPYNSRELRYALSLLESGEFATHLFSPNVAHNVENLLMSIVKKRLTKIPQKGANILQASSFGMDADAYAFDEVDGISKSNKLGINFEDVIIDGKKQKRITSFDAYITCHDSRLLRFCEKDGSLSAEKLQKLVDDKVIPESILYFVAYRTPSDAEHSIIPCKIKGFLPKKGGVSIYLPKEAMVITGCDFDGDKLRCFFKDFNLEKAGDNTSDEDVVKMILGQKSLDRITEIKYDYEVDPIKQIGKNNDFRALDNAQVDMMLAQITSPMGSSKMMIPGGCDQTKIYARTIDIIRTLASGENNDAIKSGLVAYLKTTEHEAEQLMKSPNTLYDKLIKQDDSTLQKIQNEAKGEVSPFSVDHAVDAFEYVMGGAEMIGIYAMYNSAQTMFQRTNLHYNNVVRQSEETGRVYEIPLRLFGENVDKLYNIVNNDGGLSILGFARLLNAAVDNNKAPVLGFVNQTPELAEITNFLFAAGLTEEQVHLLLCQPSVVELSKRLKQPDSKGVTAEAYSLKDEIIKNLSDTTRKNYGEYWGVTTLGSYDEKTLKNKLIGGLGETIYSVTNGYDINAKELQAMVLITLAHISTASDELATLIKSTRPESESGSFGSELSKAITKKINLEEFRAKDERRISGSENLIRERTVDTSKDAGLMYDQLRDAVLPEVTALNTFQYDNLDTLFSDYFPQVKDSWINVVRDLLNMYTYKTKQSGTVSKIVNDMILWKLQQNKELIPGNVYEEQRRIIKGVPDRLIKFMDRIDKAVKNPGTDIAAELLDKNPFLTRLRLTSPEFAQNGIRRIQFSLNGPAVQDMTDIIRAGWAQMIYVNDEEASQLAIDLYKYNLFTNGFSYGMYEFFHFAPFNVVSLCPGYYDALTGALKSDWVDTEEKDRFYDQYCMNHWADRKFLNVIGPNDDVQMLLNTEDRFIVKDNGEKGKKRTQKLMKIFRENGNVRLEEATKLSIVNYYNQITRQYNPETDWNEIVPILPAMETARDEKTRLNINTEGNINSENNNNPYAGMSSDEILNSQLGIQPRKKNIEKAENESEVAVKKNEVVIPENASIPTEINGVPIPTIEDGMPAEISQDEMEKILGGNLLHIVEEQPNGEFKTKRVNATPYTVRQARKQRVFVELNKRLREILREKNISVGVLTEAEARLNISGIALFDTAPVLANGMVELIRVTNGYRGEYALPEEFAHIALAMLGDDNKLVQRLYAALSKDDKALREAFEGMYDEYSEAYKNDRDRLIKEAAGKLVAKKLLYEQQVETESVKSILRRVIDAIKEFFKRFSVSDFRNALLESNGIASQLAKGMLSGRLIDEMSLDKIMKNSPLYQKIKTDISEKQDICSKLIKNVSKRLDVLKIRGGRNSNEKIDALISKSQAQINSLQNAQLNYKTEDAILGYMNDTMSFLADADERLKQVVNEENGLPVNTICKTVMAIRDTLAGFSQDMLNIREAIRDKEIIDNVNISSLINDIEGELGKLYMKCEDLQRLYFESMLADVYGSEGVEVKIGKNRGKKITIREMATILEKDVSLADRWFYSLADCNDFVLQAVDETVREAKYRAIRRADDIRPKIEVAINNLMKETGSRDQSFMFERDEEGNRTGNYIDEAAAVNTLSKAQKQFYDTMMEIKREVDKYLPDSIVGEYKMIMLRKSTMDKFKDAEGAGGKALAMWQGLKNRVMDTSKNVDPEYENVTIDFEGNKIDYLPIKFVFKGDDESYDDMTEDVATSMMAYAGMSIEYNEMSGIIGILENARYMASKRDIVQKVNGRTKAEKIENDNVTFRTPLTVKGARSRAQETLNDFFQMHVYGHLQKAEGNFGSTKISKRKVVDTLNMLASYSQMAINLPQRIANVSTGASQIVIETRGKGVFNAKDCLWASKIWTGHGGNRLVQTGKTDYDDKLALWMDYFDIHQENGRKNQKYGKSRMSKVFNTHLLYAGLQVGEDYLAGVTALARAKNTLLKTADGKDINMWDAYEVKYIDETNKSGAYLALKEGVTMPDGSPVTMEFEHDFAKAVAGLNFRLQGIYNVNDRSAVQQYAAGALIIMYRKWIAPALKRRYGLSRYSHLEEQWEEGYYRTYGRQIWQTYKDALNEVTADKSAWALLNIYNDIKAYASAWNINKEKMTGYERSNLKRAFADMSLIAMLFAATTLMLKCPPDDDKRNLSWAEQMLLCQLLRLRVELGSQAPTPMMIQDGLKILKSPAAALRPLAEVFNIFQLMIPWNYWTEVENGRYKGHSKAYKYFREFPVISMFKRIDNFLDPSPQINYYRNDTSWGM